MISKNQILRKQTQTNPIQTQNKPNHKNAKNAPTSLLLTTNDLRLTTREAQNKPKQSQLFRHFLPKDRQELSCKVGVSKYVCGKVWRTGFFALLTYKRQNMAQKKNEITEPASREDIAVLADDTVEQLRMAGQVQRNFLPAQLPNSNTLRWATVFEPADWVSGDIYDIARLDEQHIGFYVADAVGHSMPAALLTMFLKQAITMRQTTGNEYKIFAPAEVITNLNNKMLEQNLAGCLFVTCCYCLLNVATLQLTYARAGHPYPVMLKPGTIPEQLQSRGGLLGVFDDCEFEQETVQLTPGDKLLTYSDGCDRLVGAYNEQGKFAFTDKFCSIINLPIEQMMSEFSSLVKNQTTQDGQTDDMTAIGLEILQ